MVPVPRPRWSSHAEFNRRLSIYGVGSVILDLGIYWGKFQAQRMHESPNTAFRYSTQDVGLGVAASTCEQGRSAALRVELPRTAVLGWEPPVERMLPPAPGARAQPHEAVNRDVCNAAGP